MPSVPNLNDLLASYEAGLLGLAGRQYLVEAFTSDLDRVTRQKPFRFRNQLVWLLLLDTRDVLVIHLASWVRSLGEPGGLLSRLEADHISDFPRALPPEQSGRSDTPEWVEDSIRRRRESEHATSFDRLFPTSGAHPDAAAVALLGQTIRAQFKPVKDDRNWNRAHPFENVRGTAKMLNVPELRSQISWAEQLTNDIRLVGLRGTMAYNEMNIPSAKYVAPDLVDAMLIGDPERVLRLRGTSTRDQLYERLHAEHEARNGEKDDYFNDVREASLLATPSAGT